MKSRITRHTLGTVPKGESDWARVDAMSEEELEAAALADPDAQPLSREDWAKGRLVIPLERAGRWVRLDEDVATWLRGLEGEQRARVMGMLREAMAAGKVDAA